VGSDLQAYLKDLRNTALIALSKVTVTVWGSTFGPPTVDLLTRSRTSIDVEYVRLNPVLLNQHKCSTCQTM
jgi:hypothetical protein